MPCKPYFLINVTLCPLIMLYIITAIKHIEEFEVLAAVVMKSTIFWDITPCSPLKVNRRFGELCLPPAFTMVSCLAYYSALKMDAMLLRNVD
jgi:hypothetical protein